MARPRVRARSGGRDGSEVRMSKNGAMAVGGAEASMVPRVLLGAVNGVEIVATGALQLTRDVLVSTVSGAADIGAEALTATVGGVRGVVSAASRMVGDIAGTAQGTFWEAFDNARHARLKGAHLALRRPPASMPGRSAPAAAPAPEGAAPRARRRGAKRARTARQPRATAAA